MPRFRTFALLLPALACGLLSAQGNEFRWHGTIAAGQLIEIKGVNGSIRAEPASGSEVEVVATKEGRRSDPNDVDIRVVPHSGGVTICAVYPSDNSRRPNECKPGSSGGMNVKNNDVRVDFRVRVPRRVAFTGRTGDIEAHTVNGNVRIATTGYAQAHTVNGSIDASLGRGDWTKGISFHTVNGGISVELPPETSAEVSAQTVNGRIVTDFPMTVRGRFLGRHISGTIGSGGRELNLHTVNGGIHIRQTPTI